MVHQPLNLPPDTPKSENMVLLCTRLPRGPAIPTYLSPLDAVLGSRSLNVSSDHFWPIDFQRVDTRQFVSTNQGWLYPAICYAYAANNGHLVINETGHPVMLVFENQFHIAQALAGR